VAKERIRVCKLLGYAFSNATYTLQRRARPRLRQVSNNTLRVLAGLDVSIDAA
jgi:hypothetical protein